jgi:hypothetical protein
MANINDARNVRGEPANQYELLEAARLDLDSGEAAEYRYEHAPLHEAREAKFTAEPISHDDYEAITTYGGYVKRGLV